MRARLVVVDEHKKVQKLSISNKLRNSVHTLNFARTLCRSSRAVALFLPGLIPVFHLKLVMRKRGTTQEAEAPSARKAPTLATEQPAPAPSAWVQTFTEVPPPGYVVQRRESIHVGACTAEQEEANSSENFEERTVSLTASESVQIRQFRELRFCSGCRLWDSGVALSRWLCTRGEPDLLDKEVLELGSGVGMVGLVAARKARRVRLTDGEPRLLPNLRHNTAQAAPLTAQVECLS